MSELQDFTIRRLLERVSAGQIRIPEFQRGFIWDPQRVAHLMDSIYKGYPFGSLLFWQTDEKLDSERDLGPFTLPAPQKKYPVNYVLDGQQRLTALFVTFQTEFPRPDDEPFAVYFDLAAPTDAQASQFVAITRVEVDPARHFPLSSLFDAVEYRAATSKFVREEEIRALDNLHDRFREAKIPAQVMDTDDKATVAVVFERINRQGVKLSTLELLSAWTWSEDFDLRAKLEDLQEQLDDFAFGDVAADPDLILRCAGAILRGSPSIDQLVLLSGDEIRVGYEKVENGIKGAIDFLRKELKIRTLRTLPYQLIWYRSRYSLPSRGHPCSMPRRKKLMCSSVGSGSRASLKGIRDKRLEPPR